jgi:hypothetical protein
MGDFYLAGWLTEGTKPITIWRQRQPHPMNDAFENAIEEVIEAFCVYRDIRSEDEWLESLKADPELSALVDAINALTDLAYADLD